MATREKKTACRQHGRGLDISKGRASERKVASRGYLLAPFCPVSSRKDTFWLVGPWTGTPGIYGRHIFVDFSPV